MDGVLRDLQRAAEPLRKAMAGAWANGYNSRVVAMMHMSQPNLEINAVEVGDSFDNEFIDVQRSVEDKICEKIFQYAGDIERQRAVLIANSIFHDLEMMGFINNKEVCEHA